MEENLKQFGSHGVFFCVCMRVCVCLYECVCEKPWLLMLKGRQPPYLSGAEAGRRCINSQNSGLFLTKISTKIQYEMTSHITIPMTIWDGLTIIMKQMELNQENQSSFRFVFKADFLKKVKRYCISHHICPLNTRTYNLKIISCTSWVPLLEARRVYCFSNFLHLGRNLKSQK